MLFPLPTDPKIIEIWLNLRFEKNLLVSPGGGFNQAGK